MASAKEALARLRALATEKDRANLARFGIVARNPLGVSMKNIQSLARELGRSHDLALALWATDCYEARLLAAYVDEPARVTGAQMDEWCEEFDNWGVCDTLCFVLFDKTPLAWTKVKEWGRREDEYVKRAGFALLASLCGHDKTSADGPFLASLPSIEAGAADDRAMVQKGVSWALRSLGRRGPAVGKAALALAQRPAQSEHAGARWVGRDAVRDLVKRVKA